MKLIAAKNVAPRFGTTLILSVLVWLGGPHAASAGVDVWTPTNDE